ncbi:MAG: plasmid maintenance protein CcdB, partial [Gammaproteobacteria bacterium]
NPTFKIKNISVVLHPLEIVSVSVSVLGEPIASLKAEAERVIGSIDDLLLRVD